MRLRFPALLFLAAASTAFAQGANKTSEGGLEYSVNPSRPGPKPLVSPGIRLRSGASRPELRRVGPLGVPRRWRITGLDR